MLLQINITNLNIINNQIKYIIDKNQDFSFKSDVPALQNIIKNLEKINFFEKYPELISDFYNPEEKSNIFNDIYINNTSYSFNATFGISKNKILSLCEPNQRVKFMPYVCNELFQNFLDTANLFFNYDYLHVSSCDIYEHNIYNVYIYSNVPIEVEQFKKIFQEAIFAYKESCEPNFNKEVVNIIFQKNVLENEIPIATNLIKSKPRKL